MWVLWLPGGDKMVPFCAVRPHAANRWPRNPAWFEGSLCALCQLLELLNIQDSHAGALRQINDVQLAQLRERPAHGLDGDAEEVADVGPRHRQIDQDRAAVVALVAPGHGEQEGGDALRRAA